MFNFTTTPSIIYTPICQTNLQNGWIYFGVIMPFHYLCNTNTKNRMDKKSTNKDSRITVRLSDRQRLELDRISNEIDVRKSALIRFAIDNLIQQYEKG